MTEKDKQDWLDRIEYIISSIEDANRELEDFKEFVDDKLETDTDLNEWKKTVLNNLPDNCSVKFRMDVEEMLEKFKDVY